MKKIFLLTAFIFSLSGALFAEKRTFRTGEVFAFSVTDYFFPADISLTGSKCSITGVKKADKDLWCLSLAAFRPSQGAVPVTFEYYVKAGDTIRMRRLSSPMEEVPVKIEAVNWNEVVISVQ